MRHAREGDFIQINQWADTAFAKAARARAARRLLRHAREGGVIQNLPVSLLRQCFDQWEAAAGHPWRPDQFPLMAPGGNGCSHQSGDAAQTEEEEEESETEEWRRGTEAVMQPGNKAPGASMHDNSQDILGGRNLAETVRNQLCAHFAQLDLLEPEELTALVEVLSKRKLMQLRATHAPGERTWSRPRPSAVHPQGRQGGAVPPTPRAILEPRWSTPSTLPPRRRQPPPS